MRIKHNKAAVATMDMTPMIDMTFQLITFFMMVTNFEQTQADERVKLPLDQLAVPPETARPNDVVVNVGFLRNDDGSRQDERAFVFYGDDHIPVLDYGPYLQAEARLHRAGTGRGAEALRDVTIVIRADADVSTGLIQELIKLAQEAGFEKFSLKAQQDAEDTR